jgi:hypothetical protein
MILRHHHSIWPWIALFLTAFSAAICARTAVADEIRFNRDIRPILADTCFPCHGPDSAKRKGELRLDETEAARASSAIVPGDVNASALIARVTTADLDDRMPPPESKLTLNEEQIALLRAWIEGGAEYEPHWAFIPVEEPGVPDVADAATPIDAYLKDHLQREGIEPSPEADAETLIRRVTLDLTGLPPTVDAIDRFMSDKSPGAYERVVDRLLASPAYGERMAMDWLDIARYADTYGYQNDKDNNVWPWRDWVIEAFNQNLPYDDFITWQLAGDLLPNATQEQRLATAFNRLHRQTNEGGSINEEFRVEYVVDRTDTFGTAFLGLTLTCSRCHDHKFDPISMKDYYGLSAFFNNIDESGLYSHFTDPTPSPSLLLYNADTPESRHETLRQDISKREVELKKAEADARPRFDTWLANSERSMPVAAPVLHWPLDKVNDNQIIDTVSSRAASVINGPTLAEGRTGQALVFSGENGIEDNGAPEFERFDPFSMALWIRPDQHAERTIVAHRSRAEIDAASRGYELMLVEGKPTFSLIHFWPGNAVRVIAVEAIAEKAWSHVAVAYDGSSRADGVTIYIDGRRVDTTVVRDNLFKTIKYKGEQPPLALAKRFRDVGFKNGAVDEFMLFDCALSPAEARALAQAQDMGALVSKVVAASGSDPSAKALAYDHYVHRVDTDLRTARSEALGARMAESEFIERVREIMVMEDMLEPRQAYVLARGSYAQRAEPVQPDTPGSILAFNDAWPRNRLGLARWLTAPENPLTARVAVNRYWQMFFGRGLTESQEDFGLQGRPPTHPELLDYLAWTFRTSGWDIKALHKSIVMSDAYRRRSSPRPKLDERDPFNTLLAAGPRRRLPAEQLRDRALAVSGLLVSKRGGPSVKPYQPEGLWRESSHMTYTQDSGDALYRRSMYTFWKRTVPPPTMMTFDATNRETCVVRRESTQTPLQALILLNDPQFVEAARVLAANELNRSAEDVPKRMASIFRRVTGRVASAEEIEVLRGMYDEQLAAFKDKEAEARAYLAVGESAPSAHEDLIALASTTAVSQAIMNLAEFQENQ